MVGCVALKGFHVSILLVPGAAPPRPCWSSQLQTKTRAQILNPSAVSHPPCMHAGYLSSACHVFSKRLPSPLSDRIPVFFILSAFSAFRSWLTGTARHETPRTARLKVKLYIPVTMTELRRCEPQTHSSSLEGGGGGRRQEASHVERECCV